MSPLRALPSWLGAMLAVLPISCGGSRYETSSTASIAALTAPANAAGNVTIEFSIQDRAAGRVDVDVLFSTDGVTWYPATVEDGSVRDLASSPTGTSHSVVWDSLADVGFRTEAPVRVAVEIARADRPGVARTLEVELGQAAVARGSGPATDIVLANLGPAADRVESHLYYLGSLDAAKVKIAERHDLVVIQPCDPTVTRAVIAEIKNGVDPNDPRDDVIVLGAVSVGLDLRTGTLTDAQMALDPRFVGDGSGPRVDPRGPDADGRSLIGVDPKGIPSAALGYAAWYLDDNSVDRNGRGDGKPDRSVYGNACFVNAGAPGWFDVVNDMRCDVDGRPGMREIVTSGYGRGFACDGLFLDHVDTCSPNSATSKNDTNQVEFEWTAPGFASFIGRAKSTHSDKLIMQNRGLFFFNPSQPHFKFSTRAAVDFVLFASYRLNANTHEQYSPYYFADNKHNVVPRLQAEAYRPNGFQVLSVGHATGPGIATDTLLGKSSVGLETLLVDVFEAQHVAGFRHYLTDAHSQLVNEFARRRNSFRDRTPPRWTSTWNGNNPPWPQEPVAPTPRIGVQDVEPGVRSLTVRWDVALDLNRVHYVAYVGEGNLAAGDPKYARLELTPQVGDGYAHGTGSGVYPYQATIAGLERNQRYTVMVRAVDSEGNEDSNRVVLSGRTLSKPIAIEIDGKFTDWSEVRTDYTDGVDRKSAGPDWRRVKIFNDDQNLYIWFRSEHAFNLDGSPDYTYSRCLIGLDVDNDPFTGWKFVGIGSEVLVAGDSIYRQKKNVFNSGKLQQIAVAPTKKSNRFELAIPLAKLDAIYAGQAERIRIVLLNDELWDKIPDNGHIVYDIVR